MSDHPYGISDYFNDLKSLVQNDLSKADKELLKSLKTSWENLNSNTLKEAIEYLPITINLFVEDVTERAGPIPFTCIPSWTGLTLKEKIAFYLKFPVEFQTLIVDNHMVDDDDMLKSHGIVKEGDALSIFLLNKGITDIGSQPESPTNSRENLNILKEQKETLPGTSGLQTWFASHSRDLPDTDSD